MPFVAADMVIGPDGRYVAFPWAENGSHFQIRDVATGALSLPSATEEHGPFISFSPDGERYLTVDDAGTTAGLGSGDRRGARRQHRQWTDVLELPSGGEGRVHAGRARGGGDPRSRGDDDEDLVVLDATTLAPVGGAAGAARVHSPSRSLSRPTVVQRS